MKRLERLELCRREPVGLAEMEEKLRVIFDDRIEKLVLPSGIPPTVEELQTTVKENFGFSEEIQDEFHRITTVHLESKFMCKLDEYSPKLLNLFHSKGGAMGLRLKTILPK
ncbi:hypothetical protein INR49_005228, partial [Caranx melampygus]